MPKEKNNINIALGPEAAYEKKMIQRFYSFEERDKDRLKYYATLFASSFAISACVMVNC